MGNLEEALRRRQWIVDALESRGCKDVVVHAHPSVAVTAELYRVQATVPTGGARVVVKVTVPWQDIAQERGGAPFMRAALEAFGFETPPPPLADFTMDPGLATVLEMAAMLRGSPTASQLKVVSEAYGRSVKRADLAKLAKTDMTPEARESIAESRALHATESFAAGWRARENAYTK